MRILELDIDTLIPIKGAWVIYCHSIHSRFRLFIRWCIHSISNIHERFLTFENFNNHLIRFVFMHTNNKSIERWSQICYLHTYYRVSFVFFSYDGLYRQKNTSINAWHHMVISVCFVAVKVDSPLVWRASVDSPGKKMKEI